MCMNVDHFLHCHGNLCCKPNLLQSSLEISRYETTGTTDQSILQKNSITIPRRSCRPLALTTVVVIGCLLSSDTYERSLFLLKKRFNTTRLLGICIWQPQKSEKDTIWDTGTCIFMLWIIDILESLIHPKNKDNHSRCVIGPFPVPSIINHNWCLKKIQFYRWRLHCLNYIDGGNYCSDAWWN